MASAQFAPPPPDPGYAPPPPDPGYAPPPPGGYAPPPPGPGYAPPPPGYGRPSGPGYAPPPPGYGRPPSNRPNWQNSQGFLGRITCASDGNREQRCFAITGNRVVLERQLSQSPCIEGRTFRYQNNAIFVRDGCRGDFLYGYGQVAAVAYSPNNGYAPPPPIIYPPARPNPGYAPPPGYPYGRPNPGYAPPPPDYRPGSGMQGFAGRVVCASDGGREQRCPVNSGGRAVLDRQLSQSPCIEGRNFRVGRDAIYVRDGCRGEFLFGFGPMPRGG